MNPFLEASRSDQKDSDLVAAAVEGSREALEELILRHQAWIYNIACRMVWHPEDAEDVTQEILIKVITKLSTFQQRSSLRTWLYRIVANHVINMKKRRAELVFKSFETYGKGIDDSPDSELPDPKALPVDLNLIVEETKIGCMTAMLLCLNRTQRLTFILGSIFGVTDRIGSEILGITRQTFRQRLSRARRRLSAFMEERCGLIHTENSCHCERKAGPMVEAGMIDPLNLLFSTREAQAVKAMAKTKLEELDDVIESRCQKLFREHPFQESPDFVDSLRQIVDSDQFQKIIQTVN